MATKQNGTSKNIYTPIPKGATAPCWKLAVIDPSNQDYALCKVAKCPDPKISRGGRKGAKYSTQNVTYHMDRYHPKQFGPFLQAAAEKKKPFKTKGPASKPFWNFQEKTHVRWHHPSPVVEFHKCFSLTCSRRQAVQMKVA